MHDDPMCPHLHFDAYDPYPDDDTTQPQQAPPPPVVPLPQSTQPQQPSCRWYDRPGTVLLILVIMLTILGLASAVIKLILPAALPTFSMHTPTPPPVIATVPPHVTYSSDSIFHAFQDAGLISDPYPSHDKTFCITCDYQPQEPPRTWLASKNPYVAGEIATFSTTDAAKSDQQILDQAGYPGEVVNRCLLFWHGDGTLPYLTGYVRIMKSDCT